MLLLAAQSNKVAKALVVGAVRYLCKLQPFSSSSSSTYVLIKTIGAGRQVMQMLLLLRTTDSMIYRFIIRWRDCARHKAVKFVRLKLASGRSFIGQKESFSHWPAPGFIQIDARC